MENLLDSHMDEAALNDAMNNVNNSLDLTNSLLEVKLKRISENKSQKLPSFPILSVCCRVVGDEDIELAGSVLKKALMVVEDSQFHLKEGIGYLAESIFKNHSQVSKEHLQRTLVLLNSLVEFCRKDHSKMRVPFPESIDEAIPRILSSESRVLVNYVVLHFLPNYLQLERDNSLLLACIFNCVKESLKLDILCYLFPYFKDEKFGLLYRDDFYTFLCECLLSKKEFVKKPAERLLWECVQIALGKRSFFPECISLNLDCSYIETAWKNFFLLLDVSDQKQLHLIEPALHMLHYLHPLHLKWQSCIYERLLNHAQDLIVYNVLIHILHERDLGETKIEFILLLRAINRNEYSLEARKMYTALANLCHQSSNSQIIKLLMASQEVHWTPTAMWYFFDSIFRGNDHLILPLEMYKKIVSRITVPDLFIRNNCKILISLHFLQNFKPNLYEDLVQALIVLHYLDGHSTIMDSFILHNSDKLVSACTQILRTMVTYVQCDQNFDNKTASLTVLLKVLKMTGKDEVIAQFVAEILGLASTRKTDCYCVFIDEILDCFFELADHELVMKYVLNRLSQKTLEESAVEHLASLCTKLEKYNALPETIFADILGNTENFSDQHKTILILAATAAESETYTQSLYKMGVFVFEKTSNVCRSRNLITAYIDFYFSNHTTVTTEFLTAIENNLELYPETAPAVFRATISRLLALSSASSSTSIIDYIRTCCDAVMKLRTSPEFTPAALALIEELFRSVHLKIEGLNKTCCKTAEDLLKVEGEKGLKIMRCLSENILKMIEEKPLDCTDFVAVLVELILFGIIVQKSESPNIDRVQIRLSAVDAVVRLARSCDVLADRIVSKLLEAIGRGFNRRYFPDSMIHLQKLRICQVLLLLLPYLKETRQELLNFLTDSFLVESHQPSVKCVMQWLLIELLKNDKSAVELISRKLDEADHSRVSSTSAFVPILYQLALRQEDKWDKIMGVLMPRTMGPQFKLRVFAQVAIARLYNKAVERNRTDFTRNFKFIYDSVKSVIDASMEPLYTVLNEEREFSERSFPENPSATISALLRTVFYHIPKDTGVTPVEWENIPEVLGFPIPPQTEIQVKQTNDEGPSLGANFQKKFTPWRSVFEEGGNLGDFVLIASLIEKPANLGGLSRTCEVFGVKQLVLRTAKVAVEKEFKSLSMSSERWVAVTEVKVEDLISFILGIRARGYSVVGAEQTASSVNLHEFKFPKKTVLLLGNEKDGIPPNLLAIVDHFVEIPQFGVVRSLNVHVAGAIVVWEYCKQHLL